LSNDGIFCRLDLAFKIDEEFEKSLFGCSLVKSFAVVTKDVTHLEDPMLCAFESKYPLGEICITLCRRHDEGWNEEERRNPPA
jgi:hypothetical protein